ncbi:MAG: phosphonate C-P lyase system protein PhnH [Rhodobacteraceae bacterium]|nr:phosphonate C-P lyase system protein PhnH [Paracoccaceae bacterium]
MPSAAHSFTGGFADAPRDAAEAFRSAMTVLARPGEIRTLHGALPPAPLGVAAGALLLTLCDADTSVHLAGACDRPDLRDWIGFHTGAPLVAADQADFAIGAWPDLRAAQGLRIGTAEYPDRSCTLIAELPALDAAGAALTGPGIRDTAHLSLPETAWFQANAARFPLGMDAFFTCGARVAALPRSTTIHNGG